MNKAYIKKIFLSLFAVFGYIFLFLAASFITAAIWTLFSIITKTTAPGIHSVMNSDNLSLVPSILAGLVSLLLAYLLLKRQNLSFQTELRLIPLTIKETTVSFALGFGFNLLTSAILYVLPKALTESHQTDVSGYMQTNPILLILCLGIITPIVEEVYFRGLIYTMLRDCFRMPVAAIISAMIFGIFHGNPIQIIYACIHGIILAVLFEKHNSLYANILFHVGYNLCSIIMMFVLF